MMHKRYIFTYWFRSAMLCVVLACFALVATAKDVVDYPCSSMIEQGEYSLAWEKLQKQDAKTPHDYTVAFALYRIYSSRNYEDYNLKKAYDYLCLSQDYLKAGSAKDVEKAEAAGYTSAFYASEYAKIGLIASAEATKRNTITAWNEWLACYKRVPQQQIAQATTTRDAMAYKRAQSKNTIRAYEHFVTNYPNAKQAPYAWANLYELAYKEVERSGKEEDLRAYCQKYPNSPYARKVNDRATELEVRRTIKREDWRSQRQYLLTHNDTTRWRDTIMSCLTRNICRTRSVDGAKWGIRNLPQPYRDSCWMTLRAVSLESNDLHALIRFHTTYVSYAIKSVQRKDMMMIAAQEQFAMGDLTADQLIDVVAPYYPAYKMLQQQIADLVKEKNWSAALAKVEAHKKTFGKDYRYNNLLRVLQEKDDPKLVAKSLGDGVNTPTGNEYAPTISADGQLLYFCGTKREGNVGKEDIFLSKLVNGTWSKAHPLNDVNTPDNNEAPLSLATDGTSMLAFLSGKIAVTNKTANGWTRFQLVPGKVNISDWQADAMITSDGKAMLFAAMRKAENEQEASINIFVSLLQDNGRWGTPIDLGQNINTTLIDRSPFLHPDMHTLYFCSEGHGSLGGMDVFMSKRLRDDSWTEWSTPVNMGKVINSGGNECWYKISTDGQLAYFSKRVNKQNDIYQLTIPEHLRPQPVATISGKIVDSHGSPITTSIRWEDLDAQELVGFSKSDPIDGSFFIVLPEGRNYGYYVSNDELFPVSSNIDLRHANAQVRVKNDIQVVSVKEMIEEEKPVAINNLFFNTGEYELLPTSIAELTRVANFINRHQMLVEISGHTDDVGNDESNLVLSQNRANAVRDYLIRLGVDSKLLTTKGYGESRPVATNTTPEGRQKNRRVELQFIK